MAEEGKQMEEMQRLERIERWLMVADVVLRGGASLLCLISLALIASDTLPGLITFRNLPPFCYSLAVGVVVCSYSALQTTLAAHRLAGRPFRFHTYHYHACLAIDLLCSILLVSGSSAVLGVTTINYVSADGTSFMNQANASAGFALASVLFLFLSAALSIHRLQHHVPS